MASCEKQESPPQAAAPPAPAPEAVAPSPQVPVVVVQPAPQYVEEGATVNGVVVVEPPVIDGYVFIGGGWYYWHPTLQVWVHAHRTAEWQPHRDIHVYHAWGEHPKYRREEAKRPGKD